MTARPARGALALLLLVPMPTIGVVSLLFVFPDLTGKLIAFFGKAWIALLPLIWHIKVDRQRAQFPKPTMRGFGAAVITGTLIIAAMFAAFYLTRSLIPVEPLRAKAAETGFDDRISYLAMFAYIIVVNSLLEEYVWRWFVFRQVEALLPATRAGGYAAVFAAGLFFTVHHIFALAAWVPPALVALGSFGVFIGGTTWSWLYLRYRSIWPCYVSHVFADVGILVIGWILIFGD